MKQVCVFCGSSPGKAPVHAAAARALGTTLAAMGIGLVYGGGSIGLMGVVANSVMAAGGRVTGVIPQALADLEVAHHGLTELHVVPSMHARKAKMAALSDGFIALSGGIGTLEELFEIWTWAQLGEHDKPVALMNIDGFYDALSSFLDQMAQAGFLRAEHRAMLIEGDDAVDLIDRMRGFSPPDLGRWIKPDET